MAFSFEETLVEVYKQLFGSDAGVVKLGTRRYQVRRSRVQQRQVDFFFDGHGMRGVEQNADVDNRWAAMVRSGRKVAQFLSDGRYVASVVDGKIVR